MCCRCLVYIEREADSRDDAPANDGRHRKPYCLWGNTSTLHVNILACRLGRLMKLTWVDRA